LTVDDDKGNSETAYYSTNCPTNFSETYTPKWGEGTYYFSLTIHDDNHTEPVNPVGNPIVVTVSETTATGYSITLYYNNSTHLDNTIMQIFENAASRWSRVITGDLDDIDINISANSCGNDDAYEARVDDLIIFVSIENIDDTGNILAQAGPCGVRNDPYLPYLGMLRIDASDLANLQENGTLYDVISHEIGHVLGIGSLWQSGHNSFLSYDGVSCDTSNVITYTGENGVREWHNLGGSGDVPVENTGGSGTICSHWRESIFDDELMTGFAEDTGPMPLSELSIAALEDLGYEVDYEAADEYTLSTSTVQPALTPGLELKEIIIRPSNTPPTHY